jgi:predicted Rossmann fold nucleotide-binding protein DprA/Smf involved in DNA uptake
LQSLGAVPVGRRVRRKRRPHATQHAFDFESPDEPERDAARVLAALRDGVLEPDELCRALELPAARIQRALLTLRLRGVLVPGPQGGLIVANPPY